MVDLAEFAETLLVRTRSGRMRWTPSPDLKSFLFEGSRAVVSIRSNDGDGTWPFVLELIDPALGVVESLMSGWASGEYGDEAQPWNATLDDLYAAARSNALDLEAIMTSLLADVDESPATPA